MATKKNGLAKGSDLFSKKFAHSEGVIFRQAQQDEILIVNIAAPDVFYRADAWAAKLWRSMDGRNTLAALVSKIQKESGLPEAYVQKQAKGFVQQLVKSKLVSTEARS